MRRHSSKVDSNGVQHVLGLPFKATVASIFMIFGQKYCEPVV